MSEAAEEVLVEPFAVFVAEIQVCGENKLHEVPGWVANRPVKFAKGVLPLKKAACNLKTEVLRVQVQSSGGRREM